MAPEHDSKFSLFRNLKSFVIDKSWLQILVQEANSERSNHKKVQGWQDEGVNSDDFDGPRRRCWICHRRRCVKANIISVWHANVFCPFAVLAMFRAASLPPARSAFNLTSKVGVQLVTMSSHFQIFKNKIYPGVSGFFLYKTLSPRDCMQYWVLNVWLRFVFLIAEYSNAVPWNSPSFLFRTDYNGFSENVTENVAPKRSWIWSEHRDCEQRKSNYQENQAQTFESVRSKPHANAGARRCSFILFCESLTRLYFLGKQSITSVLCRTKTQLQQYSTGLLSNLEAILTLLLPLDFLQSMARVNLFCYGLAMEWTLGASLPPRLFRVSQEIS